MDKLISSWFIWVYIVRTLNNKTSKKCVLVSDQAGYFYPDVVKYKKLCRKATYKEYKVNW